MATLTIPAKPPTGGVLAELGQKHGADKAGHHHYYGLYERYLNSKRESVRAVLELGVAHGKSLLVWLDYFPRARVVGVDNRELDLSDKVKVGLQEEMRGWVYVADQGDKESLDRVCAEMGAFDLIVDDAGHEPIKQRVSLEILWPYLNSGGVYVIEDLETSTWPLAAWNVQRLGDTVMEGWENPYAIMPYLHGLMVGMTARYANMNMDVPGLILSGQQLKRFPDLEGLAAIHHHPNITFMEKK